MTLLKKFWRKISSIFMPEVTVGKNAPPPMNRKQRRIRNSIVRKQVNKRLQKQRGK